MEGENSQFILENHDKNLGLPSDKLFSNDFLAFVTPWYVCMIHFRNTDGFEYALKYAHKMEYISPVWFDLRTKVVTKQSISITV